MLARARLAAPASASRRPTASPSARRARASRAIAARAGKKRSIFEGASARSDVARPRLTTPRARATQRCWTSWRAALNCAVGTAPISSVGDGTGASGDENGDEDRGVRRRRRGRRRRRVEPAQDEHSGHGRGRRARRIHRGAVDTGQGERGGGVRGGTDRRRGDAVRTVRKRGVELDERGARG